LPKIATFLKLKVFLLIAKSCSSKRHFRSSLFLH
jgi:hypothetical protein